MKKPKQTTPKPKAVPDSQKDVHTEHCCAIHGCKYGEDDFFCSVATGRKPQSRPCEHCGGNDFVTVERLQKIITKRAKRCPNCGFCLNEKD